MAEPATPATGGTSAGTLTDFSPRVRLCIGPSVRAKGNQA